MSREPIYYFESMLVLAILLAILVAIAGLLFVGVVGLLSRMLASAQSL